jgi:hypothetical protein
MRLILGIGSRMLVWETSMAMVKMRIAGTTADDEEDDEDFKHIPQDPHSTNGAHMEISPDAIGAYARNYAQRQRGMGFRGSESTG